MSAEFDVTLSKTITLNDEQMAHVIALAERSNLTVEELLREEPSFWWSQIEESADIEVESVS